VVEEKVWAENKDGADKQENAPEGCINNEVMNQIEIGAE
jgi:hypothetical protein